MGLRDPPADGQFGPVSHWALEQVQRALENPQGKTLDAPLARALLEGEESDLFPLNETETLAGRIAAAAQEEGYWLCRHPDCVNILYIEGMDTDGTPNDDAPNVFNDARLVLRINRDGNPDLVDAW